MKKKILALSAAALLGTFLAAAPALAQAGSESGSAGADVRIGAEVETDAGLDTESTTAAIGADFNGALSAIGRSVDSAAAIGSMTEVSSVNVVRVGELAGADAGALGSAETEHSAGIEQLRASLEGNAAVKAALDAQSVSTDQVVAADVAADGSLIVFVR